MKWRDRELKVRVINRKVIREAQPILVRLQTAEEKVSAEFLKHPEVVAALASGKTEQEAIFGNSELMQVFLTLKSGEDSMDKMNAMYDLFVLGVDQSGWEEAEVAKFKTDDELDTLDKEEVYEFVNSFRPKLSK